MSRQFQFYSRQFQFAQGNFNLLKGNFNYGNFNFTHGDFNILTAISQFYPRQFQFFSRQPANGIFRFSHHLSATAADSGHALKVKTQNQKWIVKVDLQREKWKSQSKVDLRTSRTRGYLHETGTNSDWYEFVSVSIHFFSCVYRPKNELRPVWLHLGRWPDKNYFRAGLRPYRSHIKQKTNPRPGP